MFYREESNKLDAAQFQPGWPFWLAVAISVGVCVFACLQWQKIAAGTLAKPLLIKQAK